jgi:hypothetical protein
VAPITELSPALAASPGGILLTTHFRCVTRATT